MLDFFAAALGLLDPRLSKTLQICSELSFLRCVQTSYLFGLVFVCIFFIAMILKLSTKKLVTPVQMKTTLSIHSEPLVTKKLHKECNNFI